MTTSQTKPQPCTKCGGRMLLDRQEPNELNCFSCGSIRFIVAPDPELLILRRLKNAAFRLD